MTGPRRQERGLTLLEVTIVMILGTLITAGLVGFYLASQGLWLDSSTQAITQREASLIASTIRDYVRKSHSALQSPSPDALHHQLALYKDSDPMPYYYFWWNPSDSLIYAGRSVGGPDSGPMGLSRAERFTFSAVPNVAVRMDMRLKTANGGSVDMSAYAVFKN